MSILNEIQANNCWDCFHPARYENGMRLFGSSNVGNVFFTNIQVPGTVAPSDATVVIRRWYARSVFAETVTAAGRPDLVPMFEVRTHWMSAILEVGNRISWSLPLSGLLLREPGKDPNHTPQDPWPVVIYPRQNLSVIINEAHTTEMDIIGESLNEGPLRDTRPFVWVHLEGLWIPRSNKRVDNEHDRAVQAVITAIVRMSAERTSTVDEIASWVVGMRNDKGIDDAGKAMLEAISDRVRERAGG
jgi:hypothetical protein